MKRFLGISIGAAAVFASGYWLGNVQAVRADADRVFELRTYTTNPGKLEDLKTRFRDHTIRIFNKHGMTSIGYWVPMDEPESANTLVYMLAHKDRESARVAWQAFRADPEWVKVSTDSDKNGRIVQKVVSVFLSPTDFSQIK